jgi:hypothetical protein
VYQGAFSTKIDHKATRNKNSSTHTIKTHQTEQTINKTQPAKEEHNDLGFTRKQRGK